MVPGTVAEDAETSEVALRLGVANCRRQGCFRWCYLRCFEDALMISMRSCAGLSFMKNLVFLAHLKASGMEPSQTSSWVGVR